MSGNNSDSEMTFCAVTDKPKKKLKTTRVRDVVRQLNIASHMTGEDCQCKRFRCFAEISEEGLKWIIRNFNSMKTHNDQSSYLAALIAVKPIKQRRARKPLAEANLNSYSYSYKVRFVLNNEIIEKPVCYKAFLSIHGITNTRVQNIKSALTTIGKSKPDMRGQHGHHKHSLSEDTKKSIMKHISSFKGRTAHYSIHASKRLYLPEHLNIKKMHQMHLFGIEHALFPCSYDTYRNIFLTKFNISFGYPRRSEHYFGAYESYLCVKRGNQTLPTMENIEKLYSDLIPITKEKYNDLQVLKKFCTKEESHVFFSNLPKK